MSDSNEIQGGNNIHNDKLNKEFSTCHLHVELFRELYISLMIYIFLNRLYINLLFSVKM